MNQSTIETYLQQNRIVPFFQILHCINCHTHQWCTRHVESQYKEKAKALEMAIRGALQGKQALLGVNECPQSLLMPAAMDVEG